MVTINLKSIFNYFINGVGYGVFGFIAYNLIQNKTVTISPSEMLSIMVCSGLIGLLTLIFDTYNMPTIIELMVHFIGTTIIISFMTFCLNGNLNILKSFDYWVVYLSIYVIIWIVVELRIFLTVNKINEKVAKRNKKNL